VVTDLKADIAVECPDYRLIACGSGAGRQCRFSGSCVAELGVGRMYVRSKIEIRMMTPCATVLCSKVDSFCGGLTRPKQMSQIGNVKTADRRPSVHEHWQAWQRRTRCLFSAWIAAFPSKAGTLLVQIVPTSAVYRVLAPGQFAAYTVMTRRVDSGCIQSRHGRGTHDTFR
jgi:hypothetical protein